MKTCQAELLSLHPAKDSGGTERLFLLFDSEPKTLTAQAHRTAYERMVITLSKPSVEDMVEAAYAIMSKFHPAKFPNIFVRKARKPNPLPTYDKFENVGQRIADQY